MAQAALTEAKVLRAEIERDREAASRDRDATQRFLERAQNTYETMFTEVKDAVSQVARDVIGALTSHTTDDKTEFGKVRDEMKTDVGGIKTEIESLRKALSSDGRIISQAKWSWKVVIAIGGVSYALASLGLNYVAAFHH